MDDPLWMTFPLLSDLPDFRHRFTLRHPEIAVDAERAVVVERLWDWHREQAVELGFNAHSLCTAEQVHGGRVAAINAIPTAPIEGVDGIVTATPDLVIGIYVADCGALYLADPVTGACGIVHSGKKGSELGIAAEAVRVLHEKYGSNPRDIRAQLGPCIRPPAYEVDFASQIRASCLEAGILLEHYADCGICTSSDLRRFYSYRMEKGQTGRLLALIGRPPLNT